MARPSPHRNVRYQEPVVTPFPAGVSPSDILGHVLKLYNRLLVPFSAHLEKRHKIGLNEFRMLMMIGNQLGKSRSMYLVGIRTPWTLASEEVWIKTHRLGGKLMILAGFALIVGALLPLAPTSAAIVSAAAIAIAVIVPIVYSWWLWRGERCAGHSSP